MEEKEVNKRIANATTAIMDIPGWSGTVLDALEQAVRQNITINNMFKEIDPGLLSELKEEKEEKRRKNE